MNLEIGKMLVERIKKLDITEFIEEITKGIEKMEEQLVIDRFEGNIAICENRKSGEKKEIARETLPKEAREGNVLKYENGEYRIDLEAQNKIEERIKKKMDDLWN